LKPIFVKIIKYLKFSWLKIKERKNNKVFASFFPLLFTHAHNVNVT